MQETRKPKKLWIRSAIQIFFFGLIALIAVNHTLAEQGRGIPFLSSASLHAICPFGGVVTLHQFITTGTLIRKVRQSSLVLSGLVMLLAVLFGPVFCGWVCPLGSVQEWIGKLGKKLLGKRYNQLIPRELDKVLRYLRYLMLGWVVYMSAISGTLIFQSIDPYYALFNFWTGEVAVTGLLVLGVTLLGSLVVERPWCKYACPYGALLGITNLFRVFKIRRVESSCTSCTLCSRECPMNIEVCEVDVVRDHQCISCLECTSEAVCPMNETVVFSTGGK
jgi:polyferredoxin